MEAHCGICSSPAGFAFSATVLGKYKADYCNCSECGFLFCKSPHWLQEAYASPVVAADTGIVGRNQRVASRLHQILSIAFGDKTPALDIAGGYGLLVRHMRDRGYDFSWSDPYCENVFARGFEQKVDTTYPIVTAIEVLEHLEDPVGFIQSARQATGFEVLIMTTELYGDTPPALGDWWYYAPETGQHIGFYQERTMRLLAEKVGYQYLNLDDFHIFSTESVPTSTSMVLRRNSVARVIAYLMSRKRRSMTFDDHKRILRSLP